MKTSGKKSERMLALLLIFAVAGTVGCSEEDPVAPTNPDNSGYVPPELAGTYVTVDTDQSICYDNQAECAGPSADKLTWTEAQAYPATLNAAEFGGYDDWRLPNVKELESIVDYSRSPGTTASAAIDPVFNATVVTNEAGEDDYAFYWSGTTHANEMGGGSGCYVSFGRSLGYMNSSWVDVHGAGSQRSDPKMGDPADYPTGHGPQGDAIRIYNFVRLVRGG